MSDELDLTLFRECDYSWNDDVTEEMSHEEIIPYLWEDAQEYYGQSEAEVAYGILRELLWREPEHSAEAWEMLADCARMIQIPEESEPAAANAQILRQRAG